MESDGAKSENIPTALDFEAAKRLLGALTEPEPDLPHGREPEDIPALPGYTVDRFLGGGGGGRVYLATREGEELRLAIKIFHQRFSDHRGARRVWRELDLLAQTRLPCLPRLLDSFEHDGKLCIVTEFIEGVSLDVYCASHNLGLRDRIRMLESVCHAAQQLHERGIIHRDLKPSNVLVTPEGDVFIIDLGIAMLSESDAFMTLTQDGLPLGSPAFMAPEQARGDYAEISTRSDVYSLGAMGFLLLTGHPPHDLGGSLHSVIARIGDGQARNPRELNRSIPVALAAVLSKAVACDVQSRYASASDFGDDLKRWLIGEPVNARPQSAWQRASRWIGRHPIVTTGVVCTLLIVFSIMTAFAAVWWLNEQPARIIWQAPREPARLVTLSGRELRHWPADPDLMSRVVGADAIMSADGRELAVIALPRQASDPYPGLLSVYAFDQWDGDPVWTAGWTGLDLIKPPHITGNPPSHLNNPEEGNFSVSWMRAHDVFQGSQHEGDEIVAIHTFEPWSLAAIRVYDSEGVVLYEVWHDGHIGHAFFQDAVLYCAGVNSEHSSIELAGSEYDPNVFFAIRPVVGRTDRLMTDPEVAPEFGPLWYRVLEPIELSGTYKVGMIEPRATIIDGMRTHAISVKLKTLQDSGIAPQGFGFLVSLEGELLNYRVDPDVNQILGIDVETVRLPRWEDVVGVEQSPQPPVRRKR